MRSDLVDSRFDGAVESRIVWIAAIIELSYFSSLNYPWRVSKPSRIQNLTVMTPTWQGAVKRASAAGALDPAHSLTPLVAAKRAPTALLPTC